MQSNTVILVTIWKGNDEVVAETLQGDCLADLFQSSHCLLALKNLIAVGDFLISLETGNIISNPLDFEDWNGMIHAPCLDIQKMCCVFESSDL